MKYKHWLNEWLQYYIQPSNKFRTYKKYKSQIELHIVPTLGEYELNKLSPLVLQKFTAHLVKYYSPNTVKGIISVVKNSLRKAVILEYVDKEFTGCIIRPKSKEKNVDCFNLQEQRRIEDYILKCKDVKLFGIVFCFYTGLRIGELLALKWKDFELKKGFITVTKTCIDSWQDGRYVKLLEIPKTKNSNRVIPIPKQIIPKLNQLKKLKTCDYFINGKSEYGAQIRSYQKTFTRLLKRLNIPHKCFHSLRHTFATRALESGMDVKTLSELLGHKNSIVTLNCYAHSMMEHKTEMMNRLGKLFFCSENKST